MTEGPKGDLSGALRDMLGNPVPKPGGGFYDHAGEVNQAVNGLRKALRTLGGATDPAAVAARQKALDAIRRAEEFTQGAGL
jgi:filamentous hemagglutinin